ncbi:MAG: hypothetical protein GC192_09160 [Bacteroidetes bacterium]|nr:hypothetical protein [Bacteroidota bacterium]
MNRLFYTFFFIAFCKLCCNSQTIFEFEGVPIKTSTEVVLLTIGNDTVFGNLIRVDSFSITLLTSENEVSEFQAGEVSEYYFSYRPKFKRLDIGDEFNQRIFVSPTAYNLKKGECEYRNIDVVYNAFHTGLTDNISIGGGIVPTVILNSAFVDAKSTIPLNKNIRLGVGVAFIGGLGGDVGFKPESFGFISGFGILTVGNQKHFLNFMGGRIIGRGFSENENGFTYSIGGSVKLRRSKLFAELAHTNLYQENLNLFSGFDLKIRALVYEVGLQTAFDDFWGFIPFLGLSKRF